MELAFAELIREYGVFTAVLVMIGLQFLNSRRVDTKMQLQRAQVETNTQRLINDMFKDATSREAKLNDELLIAERQKSELRERLLRAEWEVEKLKTLQEKVTVLENEIRGIRSAFDATVKAKDERIRDLESENTRLRLIADRVTHLEEEVGKLQSELAEKSAKIIYFEQELAKRPLPAEHAQTSAQDTTSAPLTVVASAGVNEAQTGNVAA